MIRPKRAARKQELTELSVCKLKPEPTAYLIWDTHQCGLAVRVQPTGAHAWKRGKDPAAEKRAERGAGVSRTLRRALCQAPE